MLESGLTSTSKTAPPLTLTDSAAARVLKLMKEEEKEGKAGTAFRIGVLGGGCSGFQYHFDLDATVNEDDRIFEKNGARVVIDETSLGIIAGSQLDYVETLGSAGFEIKNPAATAKCGCGNSFSM